MTPVAPVVVNAGTSRLQGILGGIEMFAALASSIPSPISPFAHLADYFLKIAQAAVQTHEAITGKPFDVSLLHQIDQIP